MTKKFNVVLKVWKCDKIQYFEHYSVKASCDLCTMFKCLCMELNVSASLSVGTVLYLCVIKQNIHIYSREVASMDAVISYTCVSQAKANWLPLVLENHKPRKGV